jgi:hypothetical protein
MTDKQTPPDWVLIEAAKRSEFLPSAEFRRKNYEELPMFRALCDMIERYEQPPADRKLLCAREADREWSEAGCTAHWETALVRAIELWESGYGA